MVWTCTKIKSYRADKKNDLSPLQYPQYMSFVMDYKLKNTCIIGRAGVPPLTYNSVQTAL